MIDKLDAIRARFDELGVALTNPAIVNDNRKFSSTSKEYRSLEKIVKSYDQYINVLEDLAFNREALNGDDEELRELAKMETSALEEKKLVLEAGIRQMLVLYFLPSGSGCWTVAASQVPSGERRRPVTRGIAA